VVKVMVIGLREKGDDERWMTSVVGLWYHRKARQCTYMGWQAKQEAWSLVETAQWGWVFFFFFFFLTWVEKPKESSSILWFRQECLTAMCSNAPHVGYDMRVGLSNWEVLLFSSFSLIVLARYNTAHPYTNIYSFQVRKGTVVRKEKENQLWRKKRKSLIMLS